MEPFIGKIKQLREKTSTSGAIPEHGEWSFLRDWETPIVEDKLEVLSGSGKRDAKVGGSPFSRYASPLHDGGINVLHGLSTILNRAGIVLRGDISLLDCGSVCQYGSSLTWIN